MQTDNSDYSLINRAVITVITYRSYKEEIIMASHLKPYRGKKATAESQNIVLKRGEVFFEVPAGGVGTGIGKIKMGDGTTAYSDLPYFSSVDDTVVSWTDTADTIDTTNNTNVALLNAFVPTKNIKSLFGTAKQLLVNLDKSVTVLNNKKVDLANYYTKAETDSAMSRHTTELSGY